MTPTLARIVEPVDSVVAGDVTDETDGVEKQNPSADVLEGKPDDVDVDAGSVDGESGGISDWSSGG